MILSDYVVQGKSRLEQAKLECADPLLHMKQILQEVLGLSATQLYLRWDSPLSPGEIDKLEMFLGRRLKGEPFQYIAGHEGFWRSDFVVGKGCLIPRRETELVVERVLTLSGEGLKVAELGAGTGNIGISVLLERSAWEWHAFEINSDSVPYARRNREKLLPSSARYHLHAGDFFALARENSPYDVIVSNPPYVAGPEWHGLSKEVRHEPRMALDGGARGYELLSRFFAEAVSLLKSQGSLVSEIGSDQGDVAPELLSKLPFEGVEVIRDYAGLPRVVTARRK